MFLFTAARVSAKMFNYQVPYMSHCFVGDGFAECADNNNPAKFYITYKTFFSNSMANTGRPYWIIATDYNK